MNDFQIESIGVIHTPYKTSGNVPIQGIFKNDVEGYIELEAKFTAGLKDLDKFSHAILIYYFNHSTETFLTGKPFLEDIDHGIFAIRGPNRPNHIGFSIVKIKRIKNNRVYFTEVDMLDETPLLDIKPYVSYFDARDDVKCGWIDKHFKSGDIPLETILKE